MNISRSGFYKYLKRARNPSNRVKRRYEAIRLVKEYHAKYPIHGYRWLKAKIRLDKGLFYSDEFIRRCCNSENIKSISKRYKYKRPGKDKVIYPNLVMSSIPVEKPMQVVVSGMTAFWVKSNYYELTLYIDLWNNEIVGYALSNKKGDRNTYYNGLAEVIERKNEYNDYEMVLHSDQGSVYSSREFNSILSNNNIIRSMSRAGTPTDNAAMESINGWIKEEIFVDFKIRETENMPKSIDDYIDYFNK